MLPSHDVLILGAGFGGSLLATILSKAGMRVALVDQKTHPRFAIGESSTPLADQTLKRLALKFDLRELLPLTNYGTWKRKHPELTCGNKRGFTYFGHEFGVDLTPANFNERRLLVAASQDDQHSDTHWLRSDVDQFFFQLAQNAGADCFLSCQYLLSDADGRWVLEGKSHGQCTFLNSPFIIDATGSSQAVLRQKHVADVSDDLKADSGAVYAHFNGVPCCEALLSENGIQTSAFPYACDAAAVHHVLPFGWMWQLRFDDDTVSAGIVWDQRNESLTHDDRDLWNVWRQAIEPFPFLRRQFLNARVCRPEGGIRQVRRLQRLAAAGAGDNWAALPGSVGFIDPLHSTGIAHTLICIERIAETLLHSNRDEGAWQHYSGLLVDELRFIDQLVEGCYAGLPDFQLWCDWTMLYFAAVTSMEQSEPGNLTAEGADRISGDVSFLRAGDKAFRNVVTSARDHLELVKRGAVGGPQFQHYLREVIAPWNHVGLLDPTANGLYLNTAAPGSSMSG